MAAWAMNVSPRLLRLLGNCYIPFLANGITLTNISDDFMRIDARLRLRRRSVNPLGTMFGGSIFTFTDPLHMAILLKQIGEDHYVWDKSASIEFIAPGKADINYTFSFTRKEIDDIVEQCKNGEPCYKSVDVVLTGDDGVTVAKINKLIYIRKKQSKGTD